jgi:hypothetical protein
MRAGQQKPVSALLANTAHSERLSSLYAPHATMVHSIQADNLRALSKIKALM